MDSLFEAGQSINTGDEDVLDPADLQVSDDTEPEVACFVLLMVFLFFLFIRDWLD